MAKGIYAGVGGTPRKVKKLFVGASGVARKVKKVYVGVNGSPRLAWNNDITITKNTSISSYTSMSTAPAIATQYKAVFVGNIISKVRFECYDINLVKSTIEHPSTRSYVTNMGSACLVDRYALAVCGAYSDSWNESIFALDTFTMTTLIKTAFSALRGGYVLGGKCGNYAVFAGGNLKYDYHDTVEAVDSSLMKTTATSLSNQKDVGGVVELNNQIIFAGGQDYYNTYGDVESYNNLLIKSTAPANLSITKRSIAGVSAGGYALFAGGKHMTYNGTTRSYMTTNIVDVYDSSLIKMTSLSLRNAVSGSAGISVEDCGIIGGGDNITSGIYGNSVSTVDKFDSSLQRSDITDLSNPKGDFFGGVIGNSIIFGAGKNTIYKNNTLSSSQSTSTDIYNIS